METKRSKNKRILEQDLQSYRVETSERNQVHHSYELEDRFTSALSQGDREKVYETLSDLYGIPNVSADADKKVLLQQLDASAGIMSRDEKKQIEYMVVASITLASRVAIRSGVDPFRSYDISNIFLQRTSEVRDPEQYWGILFDVIDTYLTEIQNAHSSEMRSIHVLHAKQYVGRNLNQELTLERIAEELDLSPWYLSRVFKETEGVGLKQYIIEQRIEAAKNLLMYSDADIGTIATYVGFCSQSHFGKMFKQYTGSSPLAFRISMQK